MNNLSFKTLRQARRLRNELSDTYRFCEGWSVSDWFTATMGELGEAANVWKKHRRGDMLSGEARRRLAKELADVLTYLDALADAMDIELDAATIAKFNEVSVRIGSRVRITDGDGYMILPASVGGSEIKIESSMTGVSEHDVIEVKPLGSNEHE